MKNFISKINKNSFLIFDEVLKNELSLSKELIKYTVDMCTKRKCTDQATDSSIYILKRMFIDNVIMSPNKFVAAMIESSFLALFNLKIASFIHLSTTLVGSKK